MEFTLSSFQTKFVLEIVLSLDVSKLSLDVYVYVLLIERLETQNFENNSLR